MSAETHKVSLASGHAYNAPADQTLLEAARSAGLVLEHSCRTGRCGSCSAKLVDGRVQPTTPDQFHSPAQRAGGWILTCATAAAADVVLDTRAVEMPQGYDVVGTHPCRIDSLERVAPDVLIARLRLPPRTLFRALPGQYVDLIGRNGLKRSYSVAARREPDAPIELHVRHVPGGAFSHYWFEQARVNDLLRFEGPRGTFHLRPPAGEQLVFLATGTGLAPIKAMIEQIAHAAPEQRPARATLLWGGRQPTDHYWTPPAHDWLDYVPVLSRPDADWSGARGHVQDVLLARSLPLSSATVYACGSPAMIESARSALLGAGVAPQHFHADAFVSSS